MATWKKVVVSGSNISQLNNDANYLTAGTLAVPNSFSTASFNGTSIIADSLTGSLNFASSSGQGLTISANAGTDTLTFGLSAIPNASLENDGITIAGNDISLGGSITAATILSGTGTVSGSAQVTALLPAGTVSGSSQVSYTGLSNIPSGIVSASVLSSPSQGNAILTTNGAAGSTIGLGLTTSDSPTFTDLTLSGNLYVNGTTTQVNTTELFVEDKFIILASGSAAAGDGGIIIDRGSDAAGNIAFGYDSATDRWGYQNGLTDTTNAITIGTDGNSAFAGYVFTEAAHTSAPASGEFVAAGAIYTATSGDIFIYS
jgi:hypothetical protein